jgi:anthranilate/para-aminobenzoate synthase component II
VKYPKYAYVAPISWSIKHHVNEGRERVNFSVWSTYNTDQKNHIIDDILETVESKEMPLKGYLPMHPEANLTEAQRKIFNDYFKNLQKSGNF